MIVVLFHVAPDHLQFLPAFPANIVGAGYVAVSLFFILSGYILAYNYAPDPTRAHVDRRQFWVARVARIYPVYAFAMLLALPPFLLTLRQQVGPSIGARAVDGTRVVGLSLLMVQAWVPSLAYRMNWPSWSLSCEAFFYLLFPILVPLACSRRVRQHPLLVSLLLWIGSMATVMGFVLFSKTAIGATWFRPDDWASAFVYTPILRVPEFLLGVVLGVAYPAHAVSPRTGRMLTIGALILLTALLGVSPALPGHLLRTGLLMPVFGALVLGLASSDGAIARFLSRPSLLLLGEASYGIYILHTPVHAWLRAADIVDGGRLFTSWVWVPLYVGVVVIVSIVTFDRLEVPARRLVRDWLTPGRRETPLGEPATITPPITGSAAAAPSVEPLVP